MTSFNYNIWQGGYLPPVVPSTDCQPPYESTPDLSQANSQAANPSFSASCSQYVYQRTPTSEVSPNPGTDFYLKVINPANKKDFQLYTMHSLSPDVDSPDKLKNALSEQYGDLLPPNDKMEIGYFHQSKKMWIKNRLDLNDVWKLVRQREKVTLWSMGAIVEDSTHAGAHKRPLENDSCSEEPASKQAKKKSSSNDKKAIVTDFEHKLQQKHDNYSPFQIKIWAESLASGQYSDLDTPPGYAMFNREKVSKDGNVEVVMSGMVNMMNSLCQALTPKVTPSERKQVGLSPMKKAELRSTYLKQLSELRQLHDNGI